MSYGTNGRHDFESVLEDYGLEVAPRAIDTLWLNITRRCNQACTHCHVDASPDNTLEMSRDVLDRCLDILAEYDSIETVDMTGGAPELHPDFDYLVEAAAMVNKRIRVRHNLTVTLDGNPHTGEDKRYLPRFFADHGVEVIASLPHFSEGVTDGQRGRGVFRKSLEGLRLLNDAGYARPGTGLEVYLVHNADGPVSVAARQDLEKAFREELRSQYGLAFTRLFSVTNVPIHRFYGRLVASGTYDAYGDSLVSAFDPGAVETLVCRSLVSVGCDGRLYDCDFNQALEMPVEADGPATVFGFDYDRLMRRSIRFGPQCFGCTAGGASN